MFFSKKKGVLGIDIGTANIKIAQVTHATMPILDTYGIVNMAYQFGANPVEFNVSRDQAKAENVKDCLYHVGHVDKPGFLLSVLKK